MIYILALVGFLFFHPHHQSVTEIHYEPEANSFEISISIINHDMEAFLSKIHSKSVNLGNIKDSLDNAKILFSYIEKNLHLKLDSIHVDLELIGFEAEKDELNVYLESEEIDHITDYIEVENTLLMDYFANQQNIVHLEYLHIKQSKKLTQNLSKMQCKI
ncbi:MAG: hypothetical protein IT267_00565 [Saprospiraceae bacterium]|nr:hypothetical protein [Saprospiraceae bacterium]